MSVTAWFLVALAGALLGTLGIYIVARIIFAAYFRSKLDHDHQRSHYGRTQKYP